MWNTKEEFEQDWNRISSCDDINKLREVAILILMGLVQDPENEEDYKLMFKLLQGHMRLVCLIKGIDEPLLIVDVDNQLERVKTSMIMAMVVSSLPKEKSPLEEICLN